MNAIVIKSADVEAAKKEFGIDLVTEIFTETQSILPWDLLDTYIENKDIEKEKCIRLIFGNTLEQRGGISL